MASIRTLLFMHGLFGDVISSIRRRLNGIPTSGRIRGRVDTAIRLLSGLSGGTKGLLQASRVFIRAADGEYGVA